MYTAYSSIPSEIPSEVPFLSCDHPYFIVEKLLKYGLTYLLQSWTLGTFLTSTAEYQLHGYFEVRKTGVRNFQILHSLPWPLR